MACTDVIDPFFVDGLGYSHHAVLEVPAKGDLGRGLAVLFPQGDQFRYLANGAPHDGTPRLEADLLLCPKSLGARRGIAFIENRISFKRS